MAHWQDRRQPDPLRLRVLLALTGINLLATATLAVRERTREIGVMKAVGFTPRQVVVSIVSGSLALAPPVRSSARRWAGPFMRIIFHGQLTSQGYDVSTIVRAPGPIALAALVGAIALVAVAGTLFPARRAATLAVGEALRYE